LKIGKLPSEFAQRYPPKFVWMMIVAVLVWMLQLRPFDLS
jgi:hypothetical protein